MVCGGVRLDMTTSRAVGTNTSHPATLDRLYMVFDQWTCPLSTSAVAHTFRLPARPVRYKRAPEPWFAPMELPGVVRRGVGLGGAWRGAVSRWLIYGVLGAPPPPFRAFNASLLWLLFWDCFACCAVVESCRGRET